MFRHATARFLPRSIRMRPFSTDVPVTQAVDEAFVWAWTNTIPNLEPPKTPLSFMQPRPPTPSTTHSKLTVNFALPYNSELFNKEGKVKQIVGSTLEDQKEGHSSLVTNFESDKPAADYAKLYNDDGLPGGHLIILGADLFSKSAAIRALHAVPSRVCSNVFWVLS